MKKLLCLVGMHDWIGWTPEYGSKGFGIMDLIFQTNTCKRCRKQKSRHKEV